MMIGTRTTLAILMTILRRMDPVIRAAIEMNSHRLLPDENTNTQTPVTLIGGKKCPLLAGYGAHSIYVSHVHSALYPPCDGKMSINFWAE